MALLNDILKWTESLPDWQRDACRRLLQKEDGLSSSDYSELYALLKKENGLDSVHSVTANPLAKDHLPAEATAGETVTLCALRKLENVNRSSKDHELTFSETGMTVIYGGNGTGKSGYARVMKRACRARDQSEPIHPNAYDSSAKSKVPSAVFDVKVAGVAQSIAWSRDAIPDEKLSSISVFDAKCARSYVTSEKDVAYLPYGLDVVENLAGVVLPKVSELLEAEITSIDVSTLPFQHLCDDSEVGKAISSLSAKSDPVRISELGTLSDEELKRISELEAALKEADPVAKAEEYRLSAMRLKDYGIRLAKARGWVSPDAVEKLRDLASDKSSAEAAEKDAADALRSGEVLLPGTGEQLWKSLFEAARRYSIEIAYAGEEFPPGADDKLCPLCQEKLEISGRERLKRFNEYIKNDVAKTADTAGKNLDTAAEIIQRASLEVVPELSLAKELSALDAALVARIDSFQSSLEERRDSMLSCLESGGWDEIKPLPESPRVRVRQLAAAQLKAYRVLHKVADEDQRGKLAEELKKLSARKNLSVSLKAVLELLSRMKAHASLVRCRPSLSTRAISNKSKEFASAAVTDELKKALDLEFKALGIGHIRTLLKERNTKGKMLHHLVLDIPTVIKTDEILSEGEQRAIAIASFLAELSLANHSCGIVFDDPVSSLDHWRRRDVARRLVEEAKSRQVVVLTHDTSFLGQLLDEIDVNSTPNEKRFLEWKGDASGCVIDGLPWDQQGYKARVDALEKSQSKLDKAWPTYPGETEIADVRQQYDRLRATLERVIQDVLFNGVIKRYRDWIRVDSLEKVVGFEHAEYAAIQQLHKRCCDRITAHDPSSAKAAPIPSAAELGLDIAELKNIISMIQARQKSTKSGAVVGPPP